MTEPEITYDRPTEITHHPPGELHQSGSTVPRCRVCGEKMSRVGRRYRCLHNHASHNR